MSNTITRIGPAPAGTPRVRYNGKLDLYPLPLKGRRKREKGKKRGGGFGGGSGPGTGPRNPQGAYGWLGDWTKPAEDKRPIKPKDIGPIPPISGKKKGSKKDKKDSFRGRRGRRNPCPSYGYGGWFENTFSWIVPGVTKDTDAPEHCAAALAEQAAGEKYYRWVKVEKQIEKFCTKKQADLVAQCQGARDAAAAAKKRYKGEDVDKQIAKFCSAAEAGVAAGTGKYTPATTAEMVDELYWEDPFVAQTDIISASPSIDEENGGLPILPIAIAGIVLFGGLGLLLTRKKG